MEDRQLTTLFLKGLEGDAAAYRRSLLQLHEHLQSFVRRQLVRLRLPEADADDIVQEALIAINSKRHTYDGSTSLLNWACVIARYKLIDGLRAENRTSDIQSLEEFDDTVDEGERNDARITVRRILSLLPDRFRIPIELMKIEGLTSSETARRIGTSEVAVRVCVHRGLTRLARLCGAASGNRDGS
ncbi:MAG: sigma-70 family RNA polymerase sigma factor [Xanthobacteraceae bacterium]|nr:sigma-70 family RNA polymerase sigma factor [Xanthobacteraceae bacterium]